MIAVAAAVLVELLADGPRAMPEIAIPAARQLVRLGGDLSQALAVSAHAFSGSARERIEAAGGSATVL